MYLYCFRLVFIIYVSVQDTSKLKDLLKTLEGKTEKKTTHTHNEGSVSPTEIQAVFMTVKPAK